MCIRESSYHVETVVALAVTYVAIFRDAYAPLIRPAATVPTPDARRARDGETPADVARRAAAALEQHLERHHESIAALIVEPLIQCAGGMAMYDPEYLRLARALCDRYEAVSYTHLDVYKRQAAGDEEQGICIVHDDLIVCIYVCLSCGMASDLKLARSARYFASIHTAWAACSCAISSGV